jgi:adenosylhomocysteine nucleosidase
MRRYDFGIIGAMEPEVERLIGALTGKRCDTVGSLKFYRGRLGKKSAVIVKCGVGKVFAAIAAEAMIMKYAPRLVINTGVAGAIASGISVGDVLVASKLVQHDMDTSAIGDPKGLISGINKIYFETDSRAAVLAANLAADLGIKTASGTVASGDIFVSSSELKARIASDFGASACEMEGAAVAHVCYVNATPCLVIRAISDSADEESSMSYQDFLPLAAENSARLTLALVEKY